MTIRREENDQRDERNEMDVDYINKETLRNMEVCLLITQVGGDGACYRREKQQGVKKFISETYSPPSATEAL